MDLSSEWKVEDRVPTLGLFLSECDTKVTRTVLVWHFFIDRVNILQAFVETQ